MTKWVIGILMVGVFQNGRCQPSDTLSSVIVYSKKDSITKMVVINASVPYYRLNNFVLENLGVQDIGQALKHIPSANIKDYGGIGGLKTINYRSLGSTHTGIEQDHIISADQQTGTLNLGQYKTFGIETLEMSTGQVQHQNAFASAFLKSNMISIFNSIATSSKEKTIIKTHSEWQSLNSLTNAILIKHKLRNHLTFGIQGMHTFGSGIYDYELQNGQTSISNERAPTNLRQKQLNGTIQFHNNRLQILAQGSYGTSKQNLPGAIIFYNTKSKETLNALSDQINIKANYTSKNHQISAFALRRSSTTTYFQDYVLNSQGFIQNDYLQNQIGAGTMYRFFLGSKTQSFFIGTDFFKTDLMGSQYEATPIRQNLNSVIGITKWLSKIKIQANLTHQFIKDINFEDLLKHKQLSPFVSLGYFPLKNKTLRIRALYKNAFRIPSFNDLYYRSIGNISLLPEQANMFNLGLSFEKSFNKNLSSEITIDFYHNDIENKIIAIPTKNLFNWSMQNIGKTKGQGIDLNVLISKKINTCKFVLSTSQAYNKSIDVTDTKGFTYGHQLPYTPVYFATYHINFLFKQFSTSVNLLHGGNRYILTENIPSNLLAGFFDLGINGAYNFKFKKKHTITVKVQANNILNKNYQVIKSFPMPGRHFLFTLQYQFKQ